MTYACNCQYGSQDSRCCINRSRRRELEEAHRLGREGKPLPDEPLTLPESTWLGSVLADIAGAHPIPE